MSFATFLHATPLWAPAQRNVVGKKKHQVRHSYTRHHCGHRRVAVLLGRCHLRHSYTFSQQHSYTPVPTVVSRLGVSRLTSFFVPATLLHAGALSGVACRSVALDIFPATLLPTRWCPRASRFFPAAFLHAGAHSGVACRNVANDICPATLLHAGAHSGVACRSVLLFLSCNIPTRWCQQWCRV